MATYRPTFEPLEDRLTPANPVVVNPIGDLFLPPSPAGVDYANLNEVFQDPGNPTGGFYSVDMDTDELIYIDHSGQARVVGAIGHDMHVNDLAYLNGTIYSVNANSASPFADVGWTLVVIDPITGAKTSSVAVTLPGGTVRIAEGLAAANGKLYVSFDHLDLTSSLVGELDPVTGVISNPVNYTALLGGVNQDLDGLAADGSGTIYALNFEVLSGSNRQLIFNELSLVSAPWMTFVGDVVEANSAADDLVFVGPDIYLIDRGTQELHHWVIGQSGWASESALLPDTFSYSGVTYAPSTLTFTVSGNTNPALVTPSLDSHGVLNLSFAPNMIGSAKIKVKATNASNEFVEDEFTVYLADRTIRPQFQKAAIRPLDRFERPAGLLALLSSFNGDVAATLSLDDAAITIETSPPKAQDELATTRQTRVTVGTSEWSEAQWSAIWALLDLETNGMKFRDSQFT